ARHVQILNGGGSYADRLADLPDQPARVFLFVAFAKDRGAHERVHRISSDSFFVGNDDLAVADGDGGAKQGGQSFDVVHCCKKERFVVPSAARNLLPRLEWPSPLPIRQIPRRFAPRDDIYTLNRASGLGSRFHSCRACSASGRPSIAYVNCLPNSTPG